MCVCCHSHTLMFRFGYIIDITGGERDAVCRIEVFSHCVTSVERKFIRVFIQEFLDGKTTTVDWHEEKFDCHLL